ncbi:MAG: hypothetical protein Q6363_010355 [Candidatus Njordarchaeota archaeon]
MDFVTHLLLGFLFLGLDPWVFLGSLLPDFIYIIATIRVMDYEAAHSLRIWAWGERLHSIFIPIPILGLSMFLPFKELRLFSLAYIFHIILDIISHRNRGPRYFWPIYDKFVLKGLFNWNIKTFLLTYSFIITCVVVQFYLHIF